MKTITRGLIGLEDLSVGSSTFNRTTSTGGSQTLTQFPLDAYVGAQFATKWGNSDIGAQINAAYAALPFSGVIKFIPNADGSASSFSTPIVFGTEGKLVILDLNGGTLQFTPKTGNVALTVGSVATSSGGTAVYAGTFPNGGSNAYAGKVFQIQGFGTGTSVDNDGEYYCTASSTTQLTLSNGKAVSQSSGTHTATLCGTGSSPTAITFNNENTGGDAFVTIQQVRNGILQNGTSVANWGPGTASQAIGIDFSGAGRLSLQNFRVCGFAVGRVCLKPASWGATDINLSIDSNNTGTIFFNAEENYHMFGGAVIVNGVGHRTGGDGTAAGGSALFSGVSWDSNNKHGFIQSAGNGETYTFAGCHFENFDLTHVLTTHYIETQTGSVVINGGDALDDQSTGSIDYWFNVGQGGNFASLMVHGLQITGQRNPSTAVFVINGRGFLSGSNAASSTITNLYTTSGNSSVTSFFQNGANNGSEAPMEISGNLTIDGSLAATGALIPFTPVPTGFTVSGSPTYTGQYQKIGKLVWWQIQISQHSGSTVASTLSTSTFAVPAGLTPTVTVPFQITDLVSLNGTGIVLANGAIEPPAFSANGNTIYLTGTYVTN